MGVKISKRYFPYSYDSFSTKLFLRIPCDSPHKLAYRNFEISNLFTPYGSENFKTLLLPQCRFFLDKIFLNVPCNSPHKTCFLKF